MDPAFPLTGIVILVVVIAIGAAAYRHYLGCHSVHGVYFDHCSHFEKVTARQRPTLSGCCRLQEYEGVTEKCCRCGASWDIEFE